MNVRFSGWALCSSLCAILLVSPCEAQPAEPPPPATPTAAQAFADGEAAFARGDYTAAGERFEAAYAADPHPTTLYNAARSWEKAEEIVRAANLYRRFLKEAPPDTPNRDRALSTVAELGKRLGRIEVVAPDGKELAVDGKKLDSDTTLFVAPGSHLVTGSFSGTAASKMVAVEAGQSVTIALAIEPPQPKIIGPVAPPKVEAPPPTKGVSPWLFVGFAGATVLSASLLVWSGVDTLYALEDYKAQSPIEQEATYPEGKFKQDRTNVFIGTTAGLGVVTGLLAIFAIDWGHGTLVGMSPSEVTVVRRF